MAERECFMCADVGRGFSPFTCRCGVDANWIGSPSADPDTGDCLEHVCLTCGTVARTS
jgi:hypothetical protein